MLGTVFAIEEFSVYDGPGIRTSVFLKGCPLSCVWCHNPEGQRREREIVRSPNGCLSCSECERLALKKNGRLVFTEASIEGCPRGLLRYSGEEIESGELCRRILKNERLLVGGGVTFSGGEPLAQSDFLFECLAQLRGRLHTAVQTSGYCDGAIFAETLSLADYFLYDIKLVDSKLHQRYTGASNELILGNLSRLAASGKEFVVRQPLIPSVTDTAENAEATAKLLWEHGIGEIELLPYNKMAGGKYKMLLREYRPGFDETAEPEAHREIFAAHGIDVRVL